MTARRSGGAASPPTMPAGLEDDAFAHMLAVRGMVVRGDVTADRDYAELICEQLDDAVDVFEIIDDVLVGTGLDGESALYLIAAAVLCYRPGHFDTVLPPELASPM